jgi:hypothetical protein
VQELMEGSDPGRVPRTIEVELSEDQVGHVTAFSFRFLSFSLFVFFLSLFLFSFFLSFRFLSFSLPRAFAFVVRALSESSGGLLCAWGCRNNMRHSQGLGYDSINSMGFGFGFSFGFGFGFGFFLFWFSFSFFFFFTDQSQHFSEQ